MTTEDARSAAARAGLRAALVGRLSLSHVAPLVAFALFVAFVVILILTGLIGRRFGEGAMILAAVAFMAVRMAAHWRLRGAQKNALAAMKALQAAGLIVVTVEDSGLRMQTAVRSQVFDFADCDEAEEAAGMIYLWPRKGAPALMPTRALPDEQTVREFLGFVRGRLKRAAGRRT